MNPESLDGDLSFHELHSMLGMLPPSSSNNTVAHSTQMPNTVPFPQSPYWQNHSQNSHVSPSSAIPQQAEPVIQIPASQYQSFISRIQELEEEKKKKKKKRQPSPKPKQTNLYTPYATTAVVSSSSSPQNVPYNNDNGEGQTSSSGNTAAGRRKQRTKTDVVTDSHIDGISVSAYQSLGHSSSLESIKILIGENSNLLQLFTPIYESKTAEKTQDQLETLKNILHELDVPKSKFFILNIYKVRTDEIKEFLVSILRMNEGGIDTTLHAIQQKRTTTEKKNVFLEALYSGQLSSGGVSNGYTLFSHKNGTLEVVAPVWQLVGSTKEDDVQNALAYLLQNVSLFTQASMYQFATSFSAQKYSVKRAIVNILLQYLMLGGCFYSQASFRPSEYFSLINSDQSPFVLNPNCCPIEKSDEMTVLRLPVGNYPSSTDLPKLFIDNKRAMQQGKIGRNTSEKQFLQIPFIVPRRDKEGFCDVRCEYPRTVPLTRNGYFQYYNPSTSNELVVASTSTVQSFVPSPSPVQYFEPSPMTTPIQEMSQLNVSDYPMSPFSPEFMENKSTDPFLQTPCHHQVYSNTLDSSIPSFDISSRFWYCVDQDIAGRTPFQLACLTSNMETIQTLFSKLFSPTKLEDRLDLIYHLFSHNAYGEWAAGLAAMNRKIYYENLRDYLKGEYEITIPDLIKFASDEEDEEDEENALFEEEPEVLQEKIVVLLDKPVEFKEQSFVSLFSSYKRARLVITKHQNKYQVKVTASNDANQEYLSMENSEAL